MASKSFLFVVSLLSASVAFAAMGSNKLPEPKMSIKNFEINEVYKTASAAYKCIGDTTYGDSVSVYTEVSANIQWPQKLGELNITSLQDSLMSQVFSSPEKTIDESIRKYISQPISYSDKGLMAVDKVPELGDLSRSYFRHVDLKTVGFCENFIVYKTFYSDYTGGAHGSHSTFFVNYDLKNNKVLNYDDIFMAGSQDSLLTIIKQALCDQYYAKNLDALAEVSGIFTGDIFVTHNVYLTGYNIVFYFNPYEIGPWCIGDVEVKIPVAQLSDYLKPDVRGLYSFL